MMRIFEIAGHYLSFHNDSKLVKMALELMALSMHKYSALIIEQAQSEFIKQIHAYLLEIAKAK